MLLGVLARGMEAHRLKKQSPTKYSDRSLDQLRSTVLGIFTPGWHTGEQHSIQAHQCTLTSLLEPAIDKIWNDLVGMKPQDYSCHEPMVRGRVALDAKAATLRTSQEA